MVANARTAQIHYVNDRFSKWFGLEPNQVIGGRLGEHLPPAAGEERLGVVRLAYDSQRPVVVNDMWKGVALRVVARPLYAPGKGPEEVLVTLRTRNSLNGDGFTVPENAYIVTPRHVDKGPLASLSPREMDVFGLLAQGMSCSQIAQRLERSIKTIHRHRESIGKKLSIRTRLDLIRLAHLAGIGAEAVAVNGDDDVMK
jgi:DNA-binding CsgD family transcriptional regulator